MYLAALGTVQISQNMAILISAKSIHQVHQMSTGFSIFMPFFSWKKHSPSNLAPAIAPARPVIDLTNEESSSDDEEL